MPINNKIATNKRSGRKRADYNQLEKEFQECQEHWAKYNDIESYHKMWEYVRLACFNSINKKLGYVLPRSEIEARSLDVTCNIFRSVHNKRNKGLPYSEWKIEKVSSYVHLFGLVLYDPNLHFNDEVLSQDRFMKVNDDGIYSLAENEDSYVEQGTGIFHLNGKEDEVEYVTIEEAVNIVTEKGFQEREILDCVGILEDYSSDYKNYCNEKQIKIIELLGLALKGEIN